MSKNPINSKVSDLVFVLIYEEQDCLGGSPSLIEEFYISRDTIFHAKLIEEKNFMPGVTLSTREI